MAFKVCLLDVLKQHEASFFCVLERHCISLYSNHVCVCFSQKVNSCNILQESGSIDTNCADLCVASELFNPQFDHLSTVVAYMTMCWFCPHSCCFKQNSKVTSPISKSLNPENKPQNMLVSPAKIGVLWFSAVFPPKKTLRSAGRSHFRHPTRWSRGRLGGTGG